LYTLQLAELKQKKENDKIRRQLPEQQTNEEYLRNYYWKNSGFNEKFEKNQLSLEQNMREGRAEVIQSYIERGLIDKKS